MPFFFVSVCYILTLQAASVRCRGGLRGSRCFGGPWANLGSVGTLDILNSTSPVEGS